MTYLPINKGAGENSTFCVENIKSVTARFAMRVDADDCFICPLETVKMISRLPEKEEELMPSLVLVLVRVQSVKLSCVHL